MCWLSGAGGICARGIHSSLNLVWRTKPVAYQSLDLFPESFVNQGIYEGIDGRIEQDHHGSNGPSDITRTAGGTVVTQQEDNSVSHPTDRKDDADGNSCQGYTLPYLKYSLKMIRKKQGY